MAGIIRVAALVVVSAWLAWNLYRHVAVYLVRGRVLPLTDHVLAKLIAGVGAVVALAAPSLATVIVLLLCIGASAAVWWAQLWVVTGATPSRIVDRAGLVMRGMAFRFETASEGTIEESDDRISISVVASMTSRTHVLRVRSARGIKKVALFRANLRKFLLAVPRGGRSGQ